MKESFEQWFARKFQSPADVIATYIHSIAECAAAVGASLPRDFLSRIVIVPSDFSSKPPMIYIPDAKGSMTQKHSAWCVLEPAADTVNVPVPKIGFFAFSGHQTMIWSARKHIWRDYKQDIANSGKGSVQAKSRPDFSESRYQASMDGIRTHGEQLARISADATERAHKAAAALANAQLKHPAVKPVPLEHIQLHFPGLELSPRASELECCRSVFGDVFVKSKMKWEKRPGARIRDLVVPMYNKEGRVLNLQKIRVGQGGSAFKSFIPGSDVSCFTIVSNTISNRGLFIVSEGYKTSRVIDHYNDLFPESFTTACAFSCENIISTVKMLREMYPTSCILVARDNDDVSLTKAGLASAHYGSGIISPLQLFKGSDWADDAKQNGLTATMERLHDAIEHAVNMITIKKD